MTSDDPGGTSKIILFEWRIHPKQLKSIMTLYTNMTSGDPSMTSDEPRSTTKNAYTPSYYEMIPRSVSY